MRYDLAIVGFGPAGLSALLNAKVRNKSVIVYGNKSEALEKTTSIKNSLGILDIKGKDLNDRYLQHVNQYDYVKSDRRVQQVYAMGDYFAIMQDDGNIVEAISCIIASGRKISKDIKNEDKFFAKGISYCATCDASLFKNKKVVLIGYNEEAVKEANFTSEIVGELVFVNMYKKDIDLNDNIKVIDGKKPLEFQGENRAEILLFDDGEKISADGFFIIKDSSKIDQLVPSVENDGKHIIVDKNMKTNIKGLFAAGDITGQPYQIDKAIGEGQVAALNAVKHLSSNKRK